MGIDTYTYKQILIGLRNEFLEVQKKLDQLSDYINIYAKNSNEYYFNLYKSSYDETLSELVLERNIKRRFLERLGIIHAIPTRALMVKDNNGVYYPLINSWYKRDDFNIAVRRDSVKEFQEMVEEILNSDFAKYMTINGNITAIDSQSRPRIAVRSFQLDLVTDKSLIEYFGRNNTMRFASVKHPTEKWEPLTQEHLDYVSSIEFPKNAFSKYHQKIIEKSIDDDRPILLSEYYKPELNVTLEIQDEAKRLVLTRF